MLTSLDLQNIKAELTNDPRTLGLTVLAADDEVNANKLNAVALLQVKRRSLSTAMIFNAIASLEHQALSDQQSRWLSDVLVLGQIDPYADANIVTGLAQMFPGETVSGPAITALLSTSGSRVQQMFQAGLISVGNDLTPSDVANARQAT